MDFRFPASRIRQTSIYRRRLLCDAGSFTFSCHGTGPHQQSPQFCQKFQTENRVPVSKATWIEIVEEELLCLHSAPRSNSQSCSGIYLDESCTKGPLQEF